ncbi:MAG: hypothetical protein Q4E88_05380, partial [Coriobacteriia bacterium]|nr:hypothetical protein [Coriobacteriia bacterium]
FSMRIFLKIGHFSLDICKIIGSEANLYKFVESKNDKSFIANIENKNYINNIDTANNLAKKLIDSSSCSVVQTFGINSRDETIFKFFSNRISPKHIAKITGLGLGIVYRAIRKMNKCGYKIIHFNFDDYPRRGKVPHLKGTNPRAGILCT